MAPPFKTAEVDIMYGKGISSESSIFELALQYGIFTKAGSWFSYNEERLAQGKDAVKAKLESDKVFAEEVTAKIKEIAINKDGLSVTDDEEDEDMLDE